MKIVLADTKSELTHWWEKDFREFSDVSVHHGDIFEADGNVLVSPANSFGFMNGGLDLLISEYLGWYVQDKVQNHIELFEDGELLVGQAFSVKLKHDKFSHLICAPTMRVPARINGTVNAYLATLATLREAYLLDSVDRRPTIDVKVVIPGMGTGVGALEPRICSRQMLQAYSDFWRGSFPENLREASMKHRLMMVP